MNRKFFAVAALATLAALPLSAETLSIDPAHSEVSFTIRHIVSNVRGRFNEFSGKVNMDPKNLPASSVDFHIKTTSIDTAVPDRDKHLRSADFFDVTTHPDLTFTADDVRPADGGVRVAGSLTVRGTTRPAALDAKVSATEGEVVLDGELQVNRADFGLTWNRIGIASMDNTIVIHAVFTRA
jgi:polyisoprenoid-binding protein YceI